MTTKQQWYWRRQSKCNFTPQKGFRCDCLTDRATRGFFSASVFAFKSRLAGARWQSWTRWGLLVQRWDTRRSWEGFCRCFGGWWRRWGGGSGGNVQPSEIGRGIWRWGRFCLGWQWWWERSFWGGCFGGWRLLSRDAGDFSVVGSGCISRRFGSRSGGSGGSGGRWWSVCVDIVERVLFFCPRRGRALPNSKRTSARGFLAWTRHRSRTLQKKQMWTAKKEITN